MAELAHRRMLIAAEQIYTSPLPLTDRFKEIGWPGEGPAAPVIFRREPDVAVVGALDEGVFLAFRGTRPPFNPHDDAILVTFFDWLNDADCKLTRNDSYPGLVHCGFAKSVDALWEDIRTRVAGLFANGARRHLFVTGHSKGGALAHLAAWRAASEWPEVPIRVVTFAGARAGDEQFKRAYESAATITTTRYTVQFDPVPDLPPGPDLNPQVALLLKRPPLSRFGLSAVCDYFAVGEEVADSPSYRTRLKRWWKNLRTSIGAGGLRSVVGPFIFAHFIGPGTAYWDLVCGTGRSD